MEGCANGGSWLGAATASLARVLGHNIILMLNHQTEADLAVIALLLERAYPQIAENIVFIAGMGRYIPHFLSDLLCKSFGMGRRLWKIKVLPKVKVFLWLLLHDKLLTRQVLIRRGCNVDTSCVMCTTGQEETKDHLLWQCAFATGFWLGLLTLLGMAQPASSLLEAQHMWWDHQRNLNSVAKMQWDITWAAGSWALWRERNMRIFSQQSRTIELLVNQTFLEIQQWKAYC